MIEAMTNVPVLGLMPWLPQPQGMQAVDPSAWAAWRKRWLQCTMRLSRLTQWLEDREWGEKRSDDDERNNARAADGLAEAGG